MAAEETIAATFAREAAECLREGEMGRAIELCIAGTRAYPDYAMGHMVLGRCYEALGHTHEALAAYRRALSKLPDNPTVLSLVKKLEEKEQKEVEASIALQEKREKEKEEKVKSEPTTPEPSPEQPRAREETAFDILAKRLEEERRRRISQHPPPAEESPPPKAQEEAQQPHSQEVGGVGIVTPTMADIYVTQGAYEEALKAYRALHALHPQNAAFAARISELEQRLAQQDDDKKKAP